MLDGIPTTIQAGAALVLFGGWTGLFWMVRLLFTGKLCTARELSEKNARVSLLEDALEDRDAQIKEALSVLPEVAEVLKKFHVAAAASRTETA